LIAGWLERAPAGKLNELKLMLYTIALILVILWLLGVVAGTTMGGFIHILLVIAIVMVLLRVISGRKAI
jgi:tryptophan-rich sensory protein